MNQNSRPSSKRHRTASSGATVSHSQFVAAHEEEQTSGVFELDSVGALLRRAREQKGEDIYSIAEFLRIRPVFLAALENSRYEELPADAYVIGFLRSYSSYLGLDSTTVINRYRREMAGKRRRPQLNMPKPISESRAPTFPILIAALVMTIIIYALWYWLSSSGNERVSTEPALPQPSVVQPTPSSPEISQENKPVADTPTSAPTQIPVENNSPPAEQ